MPTWAPWLLVAAGLLVGLLAPWLAPPALSRPMQLQVGLDDDAPGVRMEERIDNGHGRYMRQIKRDAHLSICLVVGSVPAPLFATEHTDLSVMLGHESMSPHLRPPGK
jgi:hypothetical protein